jgi:hypothetical protein
MREGLDMDPEIFDTLTRALELAKTRRLALGGLLGAGLAAVVSRLTTSDIAAKHKKKHKKKSKACAARGSSGGRATSIVPCIPEYNACNPYGSPCCECLECTPSEDLYHCL